jgi:hypothetical protein
MLAITEQTLALLRSVQDAADAKLRRRRADRAKSKPRQLGQQRFERAIKETIAILRQGEWTKFEFEGACRAGIRSSLCLQSWPWADADAAAVEIVRIALHRIDAVRPTWLQGQPEYTQEGFAPIERVRCANCRNPMPPGPGYLGGTRAKKYCSKLCRDVAAGNRRRLFGFRQTRAEYLAQAAVHREKNRVERRIACEWCKIPFTPDDRRGKGKAAPQRFCSNSCAARWRNSQRKASKRRCDEVVAEQRM